ncbi:hypothetical protein [Agromyces archimandritae]|uniref:Uncharacterized protein n=1 Tax=Agromyces archimandritae TaxID=2781962 RepID=A0A975IMF0_9MICO|nr:hypothetical protein [Agromyces archimandritae]QTX03380.1 hypothetical protein G127AT_08295 [Agromyces archimandritae]
MAIGFAGCAATSEPVIPTPDALSSAEADALIDAAIEQSWKAYGPPGQERPDVPLIRTIELDEWGSVMAPCMREQGFDVSIGAGGGMQSGDVANEQLDAYNLAMFVCEASYPLDPKYSATLNEAQRAYLALRRSGGGEVSGA